MSLISLESAGEDFLNVHAQLSFRLQLRILERCVVIDASRSIDEVWNDIRCDIDALLCPARD